jgi:hypothetical protein
MMTLMLVVALVAGGFVPAGGRCVSLGTVTKYTLAGSLSYTDAQAALPEPVYTVYLPVIEVSHHVR